MSIPPGSADSAEYVLGVNAGAHDPSAALLRDGNLVAMVEQERLSGNRRAIGESPRDAIRACLAEAGIDLESVAEIAVGWDVPAMAEIEGVPFDEREFTEWITGGDVPKQSIPPIRFVNHHIAHAASAFYTSGTQEAAILVVDGRGESTSTTLAAGGPNGIEVIKTWGLEQSLGHLYGCASAWAGLGYLGAGKLMGLASYGSACQTVPLSPTSDGYAIATSSPIDGPVSTRMVQLRIALVESFRANNFPFGWGDPTEAMAHANFAASVQSAVTDALMSLAALARRESGHSTLVLAGGVALNCTANGALIRSGIFEHVWIPPFPYDAGVSLGAALTVDRKRRGPGKPSSRLPHAFWAPTSRDETDADVLESLSGCEVGRHSDPELAESVARHLDAGKLVGWWQGRAEVGQRALGARSILCDPRRRKSLVRLNAVKGREPWRPLAPAVLAEQAGRIFDEPLPTATEFMLAAWPVAERARATVPATVHVDGSARPQVVHPSQARYYDVIRAFHELTGVPALINTSFNLGGQPIVLTARDAIRTFLDSDLDVLVLGDLVAEKPQVDRPAPETVPQPKLDPFPWLRRSDS